MNAWDFICESLNDELITWIESLPEPMQAQIKANAALVVSELPETPEAIKAAYLTARFSLSILNSLADQVGNEYLGDNEDVWRVLGAAAAQDVFLLFKLIPLILDRHLDVPGLEPADE